MPVTEPALMVTAAVPDEVSVTVWYAGLFRFTSPKGTLVDSRFSLGPPGTKLIVQLWFPPPDDAVRVAIPAVLTADTVAVKPAVVEPAATVTVDGTVTAVSLLERLTDWPPAPAAAFSVTVHVSVPDPVIEAFEQLIPVRMGCPVPLRLMAVLEPVDELLVRVTEPLTAPPAVGAKSIVSIAAWPGFSVRGKLTPETEKPVPVTVSALRTKGEVPEELNVTAWLDEAPTPMVPKLTVDVLKVSSGNAAPRLIA